MKPLEEEKQAVEAADEINTEADQSKLPESKMAPLTWLWRRPWIFARGVRRNQLKEVTEDDPGLRCTGTRGCGRGY